MFDLGQQVLRTDVSGMPLEWIDYRDAARLYHQGQVAYFCGQTLYRLRGGISALTGFRSSVIVHSIIATVGTSYRGIDSYDAYIPPLNNKALFKRDGFVCLYCARRFKVSQLSRDHIMPVSRGGDDEWNNVATACRRCNNHKA
ncbi:MAG: HNH endonuclease, partial [Gammaproteobacteria bacterium]|nr:HNH endonuclease [Gammaproteobacteria bacterium]